MAEEFRPLISPIVVIDHDREKYKIQVELPGVKKDDIDLEVSESSFCIHAEREDVEITGCYFLAHPVNVEETAAAFDGSMLNVEIPFKVPIKGKRIDIREGTLDIGQQDPRKIEMREGKKYLGVGAY
jgi:HSP20 family protein